MPVIAEADFENGTVSSAPPSPWTTHIPTNGAVEIAADPAAGARGNVLKISEGSGSTADYAEAKFPFYNTSWDKLVLVAEFYASQGTKTLNFGFYANGTRYDLVQLSAAGTIKYKRQSDSTFVNFSTAAPYSVAVWTRLRIVIDRTASAAELVMVSKDDADLFTAALDLPSIPDPIDGVAFVTEVSEDVATFYVNDVQVLEKTAVFTDTVLDEDTAPVQNARVVLVRHQTKAVVTHGLTDANGVYSLSADAGVYYDVVAYHDTLEAYGGSVAPWAWGGAN